LQTIPFQEVGDLKVQGPSSIDKGFTLPHFLPTELSLSYMQGIPYLKFPIIVADLPRLMSLETSVKDFRILL
jgi:hypothetical protein